MNGDNVNHPAEKKQINQIAGKIYNDIISVLGKDKFEVRSNSKPNEYGDYIIQVRKKSAQPQAESIEQTVNEALTKFRKQK